MKDKFLENAKHEYTSGQRIRALAIEAPVFLVVLPGILVYLSPRLDRVLGFPPLSFGVAGVVLGCLLIAAGIGFAWWSIYVQFTTGRGTPVPVMATQALIVQPPYNYCRNPMALGTIVAFLGVAALLASISAFGLVLLAAAILLLYIRFLEEKEMEARFGESYREYRKRTPFIVPRFW